MSPLKGVSREGVEVPLVIFFIALYAAGILICGAVATDKTWERFFFGILAAALIITVLRTWRKYRHV